MYGDKLLPLHQSIVLTHQGHTNEGMSPLWPMQRDWVKSRSPKRGFGWSLLKVKDSLAAHNSCSFPEGEALQDKPEARQQCRIQYEPAARMTGHNLLCSKPSFCQLARTQAALKGITLSDTSESTQSLWQIGLCALLHLLDLGDWLLEA